MLILLAVIVVLAVLWTAATVAGLPGGAGLLLAMAWIALPGVALARAWYGDAPQARRLACCLGPAIGYVCSVLVMLGLWLLGARHLALLLFAPLPVFGLARLLRWWLSRRSRLPGFRLPHLTRRDAAAMLLLLLIVPLVVARPFNRVASDVPDGRAYRAYFTADFVWAMTVVGEVSKGKVPPENPFRVGSALNYYWLSHFLSAAEYRTLRGSLTREQIILVNSVGTGLLFLLFFFGFARQFIGSAAAAAAGCVMAFLANSYEGTHQILTLWMQDSPLALVRYVNIDAITRWVFRGMPVDGLHRMLLYQPHHLMGYAAGAAALLVLVQAERTARVTLALGAGLLLATSLLFSSFIAIIFGAAVALVYAVRLARERAWTAVVPCAVAGAVPAGLAVWIARLLHYVPRHHGPRIDLGLNPQAAERWPLVLLLNFGPLLVVGALGAALALRHRARPLGYVALLALVGFGFYFFVDVADMQHVWVGWRAGHVTFIGLAVLSGYAVERLFAGGRAGRITLSMLVPVILLGVPTVVIDAFNAQDVDNRAQGPTFPWTLVLTPSELEAFDWIREHVPPDAVMQVEPFVRDTATWAYLPAFAERRTAAGLPISMVPFQPYETASRRVRDGIYEAPDAATAYETAVRMGIEYVVVGPPERRQYPQFEERMAAWPGLFVPVFENGEIRIYRVGPPRRR